MYLSQMTDAQLLLRAHSLNADIMATSQKDYEFDGLCLQHDAVVEELQGRGIWGK